MTTHSWNGPNRQPDGYVDRYSSAKVAIAEEHWVVHAGIAFTADWKFTSVLTGTSVDILLVPNAGNYPHVHRFDLAAGRGDVDVLVYENPTVSDNGTEITPGNMNRNSTNTPVMDIFYTPTVSTVGDLMTRLWVPPSATGQGQQVGVFLSTEGSEWILHPDRTYLVRVTNNSGATISIWEQFMFYELADFG